jgi:SnoaL-like domain
MDLNLQLSTRGAVCPIREAQTQLQRLGTLSMSAQFSLDAILCNYRRQATRGAGSTAVSMLCFRRPAALEGIHMSDEIELLIHLYDRFNARDMETVLTALHEDVLWANGMEGGHVRGRNGVRSYWTRQWAIIDPHVEPVAFSAGTDGETVVEVHQTVRDLQGEVLVDQMVGHIFRIESNLVRRFDIRRA